MSGLLIVGVVLVGAVPIMCLEIGYRYGVKETERRWSKAVAQYEDWRKCEAAAAQAEQGKR